jgi:glyoxylase-like metal-dependent hydrolase (beta-lactamase superfamily II)
MEYQDILMWRPYFEVLARSHLEINTRLPDVFVDEEQNFDGPDRRVKLITKGAGHTESDLILYLPDDKILFAADLIFNQCHPYMAHGSIGGLKDWLDYLETLNVETVVPGHGPLGSETSIAVMKDYVQTLENLAREMIANGKTAEETGTIEIPKKYKSWWFDRFFYYNLKFAYNNISNK